MANITERIDIPVFSAATLAILKDNIQTITDLLPDNASLTPEQRKKFSALKVSNKVFAENVLAETKLLGPDVLPSYLNTDTLKNALEFIKQINELESFINNISQRLQDAKRIAGHQAYSQSTVVYQLIKLASDAGVPNAKAASDKLKQRFTSNNRSVGRKPDLLP